MLFIYLKPINFFMRSVLKPFKRLIPAKYQIPVNGVFSLGIGIDNYIFLHSNPTSHITKVLYWNGIKGYEFPTVKIFMKLVKKSSRFYDIGAHFGYYSMLANAIKMIKYPLLPLSPCRARFTI